jgi:hypothetical protein
MSKLFAESLFHYMFFRVDAIFGKTARLDIAVEK